MYGDTRHCYTAYLYCFLLPFGLVDTVGFMTPFVVAIVAYTFFGLDALGDEIEEPFGLAANHLPLDSLTRIINDSINQTLSRTIITAGTTFLAVLALYLFGGEVLEGFAFTMLVGIISGTYSTIFIAAAIAIILGSKQAKGRTTGGSRKAS